MTKVIEIHARALHHESGKRCSAEKRRNMSLFTGSGVAIITPMNEDKSVNFKKLGAIIDDQIKNHTCLLYTSPSPRDA